MSRRRAREARRDPLWLAVNTVRRAKLRTVDERAVVGALRRHGRGMRTGTLMAIVHIVIKVCRGFIHPAVLAQLAGTR